MKRKVEEKVKQINNQSPIHIQVREQIREQIEEGIYQPGDEMPSEIQLAKEYGINRLTVHNAITALVNEGLVKRIQGKGLFVAGKLKERNLGELGGFTQTVRKEEAFPGRKLLFREVRPAGIKYARLLDIGEEEEIIYLRRLFLTNNEPYSIEETYIPFAVCPELEKVDMTVFSLYETLEFHGVIPKKAKQSLSVTMPAAKEARLLKIGPDTPVLLFEYTSYDENGKKIEFNRSYTRSDRNRLVVHYKPTV
ncbi:GntR family transcriptional regulator [Ruminococcus sp. AF18-22]|nr:GntR family transcriptional regulator [Ruminococcus sp. AF18-22]